MSLNGVQRDNLAVFVRYAPTEEDDPTQLLWTISELRAKAVEVVGTEVNDSTMYKYVKRAGLRVKQSIRGRQNTKPQSNGLSAQALAQVILASGMFEPSHREVLHKLAKGEKLVETDLPWYED